MRAVLLILSLLIAYAAPAQAERASSGLKILMTGNDSKGWEAVGRLNMAGKSFCTGALIAPDLVLTAAHCMFDVDTGRLYDASEIEFLAGWRNGRASAYRGVRAAIPHPEFKFTNDDRVMRVAHDLALLKLDQPVNNTSVIPFSTATSPRRGDEVGVVSYAHDRANSPSLQELCHVLARQSGILVMTCDVDFGSSGAPVFMIHNGKAQIVSVVSAKADMGQRKVSLGTSLQQPLSELKALMAKAGDGVFNATPVSRRIGQDTRRPRRGAKFLRP